MPNKENTAQYLLKMEDDSLQNIKQKISEGTEQLIDKKIHPMAGGLMDILSDSEVIAGLSVDNMIKMRPSIMTAVNANCQE